MAIGLVPTPPPSLSLSLSLSLSVIYSQNFYFILLSSISSLIIYGQVTNANHSNLYMNIFIQ